MSKSIHPKPSGIIFFTVLIIRSCTNSRGQANHMKRKKSHGQLDHYACRLQQWPNNNSAYNLYPYACCQYQKNQEVDHHVHTLIIININP